MQHLCSLLIKGVQAQHEYYVSMVPLEVIAKILQFADEELPPEVRAQRSLNKTRIPEIRDYILNNPDSYVFSALTVSVDGEMTFECISNTTPQIGTISIGATRQKTDLAIHFWTTVSSHMVEWNDVRFGRKKSSEVRKDSICSLSITLVAIGSAGNSLIMAQ